MKNPMLLANRLRQQLREDPDTGCWIWTGQIANSGYGRIMLRDENGKNYFESVHRLSYQLFVEPLADNAVVHQVCGNRLCANPDHLEVVNTKH